MPEGELVAGGGRWPGLRPVPWGASFFDGWCDRAGVGWIGKGAFEVDLDVVRPEVPAGFGPSAPEEMAEGGGGGLTEPAGARRLDGEAFDPGLPPVWRHGVRVIPAWARTGAGTPSSRQAV